MDELHEVNLTNFIADCDTTYKVSHQAQTLTSCIFLKHPFIFCLQMKVMDNKLFDVSPKRGCLKPGDTCSIMFTYHHLMAGTDRVPVLLKLSRGREILVCYQFSGDTYCKTGNFCEHNFSIFVCDKTLQRYVLPYLITRPLMEQRNICELNFCNRPKILKSVKFR